MHNYYKLASTVIECVREGTFSAQKLEEMKQKIFTKVGENDGTEAWDEDGGALQEEEEVVQVDFPHSKYILVSID